MKSTAYWVHVNLRTLIYPIGSLLLQILIAAPIAYPWKQIDSKPLFTSLPSMYISTFHRVLYFSKGDYNVIHDGLLRNEQNYLHAHWISSKKYLSTNTFGISMCALNNRVIFWFKCIQIIFKWLSKQKLFESIFERNAPTAEMSFKKLIIKTSVNCEEAWDPKTCRDIFALAQDATVFSGKPKSDGLHS